MLYLKFECTEGWKLDVCQVCVVRIAPGGVMLCGPAAERGQNLKCLGQHLPSGHSSLQFLPTPDKSKYH